MSEGQDHHDRLDEIAERVNGRTVCRECGIGIGAGYLCDECDRLEVLDD